MNEIHGITINVIITFHVMSISDEHADQAMGFLCELADKIEQLDNNKMYCLYDVNQDAWNDIEYIQSFQWNHPLKKRFVAVQANPVSFYTESAAKRYGRIYKCEIVRI